MRETVITCPFCSQKMQLNVLEGGRSSDCNKTFAWVCTYCPTSAVEWHDNSNSKAAREHLELPQHPSLKKDVQSKTEITCPSCEEAPMNLKVIPVPGSAEETSSMWSCTQCPCIVGYTPTDGDKAAFKEYYSNDEKFIHDSTTGTIENNEGQVNKPINKEKQIVKEFMSQASAAEAHLFRMYKLLQEAEQHGIYIDFTSQSSLVNKHDRNADLLKRIDKKLYQK